MPDRETQREKTSGGKSACEPHVVVYRANCPECASAEYHVVTVPKLATGEHFPIIGKCETCGYERDLKGEPPVEALR